VTDPSREPRELAEDVHYLLRGLGATLAVGESLTGGLVGAQLTSVPGASETFLGAVTAYATAAKATLLDVDTALLERVGAVDPAVAVAMARGARLRFGATFGLATTGVAGPDGQDGKDPGTVHLAVAGPAGERARSLLLPGDRDQIRAAAVAAALGLLVEELRQETAGAGKRPG
jgi:nicotinamide-nucleotide amidase